MKGVPVSFAAEPFFLKTESGQCFCLFHRPHSDKKCQGGVIYVHPFGDEMNKSRRMAAMQARTLAASGFGVLQIDLFGCGDSSGEFCDARWDIWKRDLSFARNWLENSIAAPVSLWGLRLGALLALDFASDQAETIERMILWQPVISGELFLNQFLRLRMANEILGGAGAEKTMGTSTMRKYLASGETLEVAGYELASDLAAAIDSLKASKLVIKKSTIHWFEIVAEPGRSMTPAGAKVLEEWKRSGVDPHVHLVPCPPFWATQEISECPELISATAAALAIAA